MDGLINKAIVFSVFCIIITLLRCFKNQQQETNNIQSITDSVNKYNTLIYNNFRSQKFTYNTNYYSLYPNDITKSYYTDWMPNFWLNNITFTIGQNVSDSMYLYFHNPPTPDNLITRTNYFNDSTSKANLASFNFHVTKNSLTGKYIAGINFLDIPSLQMYGLEYPQQIPETTYDVISFNTDSNSSPAIINLTLREQYINSGEINYIYIPFTITKKIKKIT